MKEVEVNGEIIDFPDSMSWDEVKSAVKKIVAMDSGPKIVRHHSQAIPEVDPQRGTIFDSVGQGTFLGFSDELAGAFGALPAAVSTGDWDLGKHYKGIRDQARSNEDAFSERNPKTALASELAGGLLTGGAGFAKAAPLSLMKTMGVGAGLGATAGAGHSTADSLPGVAGDAAVGGLIGGVTAPVLPLLGRGFKKIRSNENRLNARMAKLLRRDDITPDELLDNVQRMGPNATIADAGGPNLLGAAETIANTPGRGQKIAVDFLKNRQMGQAGRIDDIMNAALGSKQGFHAARKGLEQKLQTEAKPFYDAAYATDLSITPRLQSLHKRLEAAGAITGAKKDLRIAGKKPDSLVRLYDYAKRYLDDAADKAFRAGKKQRGSNLSDLKRELLQEIDPQVPDYVKARSIYSGPAQSKSALERGRKFLREDAEVLEELVEDLSPVDMEFFRIGALRALRDRVMSKSDTADSFKSTFNIPLMREKIRTLFDTQEAFDDFVQKLGVEAKFFETGTQVLGNSATARRLAQQADSEGLRDLVDVSADVLTGGYGAGGGAMGLLRRAGNYVSRPVEQRSEAIRDEMARRIFSQDPAARDQLVRGLLNPPVLDPRLEAIMAAPAVPVATTLAR